MSDGRIIMRSYEHMLIDDYDRGVMVLIVNGPGVRDARTEFPRDEYLRFVNVEECHDFLAAKIRTLVGLTEPPKNDAEQHWKGIGKLIEECGEVLQLLGKAIAFPVGPHPDGLGAMADRLPDELADLQAAIQYFREVNIIDAKSTRQADKGAKFRRWGLPGVHDMQAKPYASE